jgi:hypothetical protein
MRAVVAGIVCLTLGSAEVLQGVRYRAVTLAPNERKRFRVPMLERVTASSGQCIEEGMDVEEPETFWLDGTCSGVRTAMVWLTDGSRVTVLACAEGAGAPAKLVKLRAKAQAEVKGWRSVTACVREGAVELWGWVETEAELKKVRALERKLGDDVHSKVELIEEG